MKTIVALPSQQDWPNLAGPFATLLDSWRAHGDEVARNRKMPQELARFGFHRTRIVLGLTPRSALAWLAVIIGAVVIAAAVTTPRIDGVIAIVAIVGVVVALHEWIAGRHEASMDAFYRRLDHSNEILRQHPASRVLVMPDCRDDNERFEKRIAVFTELDNFEYALEKYRLGYMTAENAYRALSTFAQRCTVPEFRQLLHEVDGEQHGYHDVTREAARKVLAVFEGTADDAQVAVSPAPAEVAVRP